jgi:2-dehydro-3-deoxygluconokinase
MSEVFVAPSGKRQWDCVALGEVMIRFDPGELRIHTARRFDVWEGGGEYNVVRGLRRCFGLRTAVVTAFADNPVGRLVEDLILQAGVDTALLTWVPYDGAGRNTRNGLYFMERGFGVRASSGCMDRGNTAVSQIKPGQIDWDTTFGPERGAGWFHTGGVFAALSEHTPAVAREAMDIARRHGTYVSYDLNYRESLWSAIGGRARAAQVNDELVRKADVVFGIQSPEAGELHDDLTPQGCEQLLRGAAQRYPNLKMIATTLRSVHSSSRNGWGAMAISGGVIVHVPQREIEVLDRVGAGDAFASGVIYGLLSGWPAERALKYGVAHGALAMTTPGDNSMATLCEVQSLAEGESIRIKR